MLNIVKKWPREKGCDFMTNEIVIEELNTLLRGTYMGVRSFEHYIQKLDDEEIETHFQSKQQYTKLNAQKIQHNIADKKSLRYQKKK